LVDVSVVDNQSNDKLPSLKECWYSEENLDTRDTSSLRKENNYDKMFSQPLNLNKVKGDVKKIECEYENPILDFKFKNRGREVAFFKRVDFEVLEAVVDVTPILKFMLGTDDKNNLQIII
jgi:hypothetical protein